MNGLRASNFQRIHLGLLLDLLLLFLLPAVLGALAAVVARQAADAGMENATAETLLQSPTLAVRALYSFLVLQYCLSALCALLVVSGIAALESTSGYLRRAKRFFLALMLAEALTMLAHITDLLLPDNGAMHLATIVFIALVAAMLVIRCGALRTLLLGYGEVLGSVGAQELSARACAMARRVTAAFSLLLLLLVASMAAMLLGVKPLRHVLLSGDALALAYYVVIYVQTVGLARKTRSVIATISE